MNSREKGSAYKVGYGYIFGLPVAWGKGVISAIYPKEANGQLIFLETNFHF